SLGGHNFVRFDGPMMGREGDAYAEALLRDDRIPRWGTVIDAFPLDEQPERFALEALGRSCLGAAAEKPRENVRLFEHLRRLPDCTRLGDSDLKGTSGSCPR